jgi:hypothetical protein
MKQHILEQFIDRVIDILVESRLDERIQANKDFKNAILMKRHEDWRRKKGKQPLLRGMKDPKAVIAARSHIEYDTTARPGAYGHKMLDKAGEARRKGNKKESSALTTLSRNERGYSFKDLPAKKPLP